ncbi:MAG TPA: globin [Hyphomonadaceae bacterium]|nr:globin [Hyphomonadaceae bacterium]
MSLTENERAGMQSHDLIALSLERAGEICGDPTSAVYERLFARLPETRALFVMDRAGLARGNMLMNVFDVVLDVAGPRRYGANMVMAEIVNHQGIGVSAQAFPIFFEIVMETIRDVLGGEWTAAMQAAWDGALRDLRDIARAAAPTA